MPLIRLAYASEATFEAKPLEKGVEPHVARILLASRRNNVRSKLVGGLYYGDNRFFQYLEGEEQAVKDTFARILKDARHRNVVTLIEEPLSGHTFTNWSMKYVPLSSDVRRFLADHNLARFEPADFTPDQCDAMIQLIRASSLDQKLINYDDDRVSSAPLQVFSPGLKAGLIVAALGLLVAVVFAGSML